MLTLQNRLLRCQKDINLPSQTSFDAGLPQSQRGFPVREACVCLTSMSRLVWPVVSSLGSEWVTKATVKTHFQEKEAIGVTPTPALPDNALEKC